jgi:hypothetical protein
MRIVDDAHGFGIKLEVLQGLPVWSLLPSPLHAAEVKRIDRTLRSSGAGKGECSCNSWLDVSIGFPDGSLRRPDISIYCELPPLTQESATMIPLAVVEVVSPGSEIKDIELSPNFYLMHGVLDVVVFDPSTGAVLHYRKTGRRQHLTPVEIELECGCLITV